MQNIETDLSSISVKFILDFYPEITFITESMFRISASHVLLKSWILSISEAISCCSYGCDYFN